MLNLKNGKNDLICKVERDKDIKNKHLDNKVGREWGGMNWEIGIDTYTLSILCIK